MYRLGMVDGMVTMMPNVKVGHIGLFRDPQTLEPVKYYFKMPPDIAERDVIIVDPMLATGGSASAAVKFMKEVGCKHIKLMCIIGAPEGVQVMQTEHRHGRIDRQDDARRGAKVLLQQFS